MFFVQRVINWMKAEQEQLNDEPKGRVEKMKSNEDRETENNSEKDGVLAPVQGVENVVVQPSEKSDPYCNVCDQHFNNQSHFRSDMHQSALQSKRTDTCHMENVWRRLAQQEQRDMSRAQQWLKEKCGIQQKGKMGWCDMCCTGFKGEMNLHLMNLQKILVPSMFIL